MALQNRPLRLLVCISVLLHALGAGSLARRLDEGRELEWIGLYAIGEANTEHWAVNEHDEHEDEHDEHEDEDHNEDWEGSYTMGLYPNNGTAFSQPTIRFGCVKHHHEGEEEEHEEEEHDEHAADWHYSPFHEEMEHAHEKFVAMADAIDEGRWGVFQEVEAGGVVHCNDNMTMYELQLNSTQMYGFQVAVEFNSSGEYAVVMEHEPNEFADAALVACAVNLAAATVAEEDDGHDGHGHRRRLAEEEHEEHDAGEYRPDGVSFGGSEVLMRDRSGFFATALYDSTMPRWVEEDEEHMEKDWMAMVGALVTALPSLMAILLVIPLLNSLTEATTYMKSDAMALANSFAMGTLTGAACFLVLPEGMALIAGSDTVEEAAGSWGAMLCVGFLFCHFLHVGTELISARGVVAMAGCEHTNSKETELVAKVGAVDVVEIQGQEGQGHDANVLVHAECWDVSKVTAVAYVILIGDFMHNFTDGIFVAAAFSCGPVFGWSVVGVTVAHEFPQEMGDFIVLTTSGGMTTFQAMCVNFFGGMSSVLGAFIFLTFDPSDVVTGCALTLGGSMYLYTALAELASMVYRDISTGNQLLGRMASYCVGCGVIAVVLLNHTHCEAVH
jgi:zinc transporter ZupT